MGASGDDAFRGGQDAMIAERCKSESRRIHPAADLPAYAHGPDEDAGMDLHAVEDVTLEPGVPRLVPTGLTIELPPGYEAQVRPRSGLALQHAITMPNAPGTIDPGYRGEMRVILLNLGREPYTMHAGDRIAQMIVARYEAVEWVEGELAESQRGEGGFGSPRAVDRRSTGLTAWPGRRERACFRSWTRYYRALFDSVFDSVFGSLLVSALDSDFPLEPLVWRKFASAPVVGYVPARAFEVQGGTRNQLLERSAAALMQGQGLVGKLLSYLDKWFHIPGNDIHKGAYSSNTRNLSPIITDARRFRSAANRVSNCANWTYQAREPADYVETPLTFRAAGSSYLDRTMHRAITIGMLAAGLAGTAVYNAPSYCH